MAAAGASKEASSQTLKRNSDDMGWEFAMLIDPDDLQRVQCKLCGKEMSGGVNRMKQHIGQIRGQVTPCLVANAEQQARCKAAFEAPQKKKLKEKQAEEVRAEVTIDFEDDAELNIVDKVIRRMQGLWINMWFQLTRR
jgi:transposase